jgi:hypothetical protein
MDTDPRLIEALSRLLDGTELSLSTIAAWALGRIGDESALPALRKGLNSEYRSIRGHCARALGTLHDKTILPILLERLPTETDKGLRIAYAVALGQLGAPEVVDPLLETLRTTENEGARMELSLSIARLTGYEQSFIRQLRRTRQLGGTAVSQTVFALRRKLSGPDMEGLRAIAQDCAAAFARDDFAAGVSLLSQLITELPKANCSAVALKVIDECDKVLRESGASRMEYVILALHTLEIVAPVVSKAPIP